MGFIKILRWRIGGALSKLTGLGSSVDIGPVQRAAVFTIAVGREHANLLFRQLTAEEARLLSSEMNRFSDISEELVDDVLSEFLFSVASEDLPDYVSLDDAQEVVKAHLRADASGVVDRVRTLWLQLEEDSFEDDDDDDSLLELEYDQLELPQKAAVFMMWLPPELSAMVLAEFSADLVHQVTNSIVELPFVTPKARELVLGEFMDGVTLGIPGLSVDDVGLPIVVEAFVRSNPNSVAKRLEQKWMSKSAVVVPSAPVNDTPTVKLTDLEKTAIFFQSLSLPLAYRLLSHLEESEVASVLDTIDELGGVDSETRKTVLKELMLASRPQLAEEPQPIHVLGKAMGAMIRRRPEVVVHQIRKKWLAGD